MSGVGWFKKGFLGLMGFEMYLGGGTQCWVDGLGAVSSPSHQRPGPSPWLMAHGSGSQGGCYPPGSTSASPPAASAILGGVGWTQAISSTFISYPASTNLSKERLSFQDNWTNLSKHAKPVSGSELRSLPIIAPLLLSRRVWYPIQNKIFIFIHPFP